MGNLNVTYTAASLGDLADGLMERAEEKREEADGVSRQRDQRDLRQFALGIEWAADVVRNTTIKPGNDA